MITFGPNTPAMTSEQVAASMGWTTVTDSETGVTYWLEPTPDGIVRAPFDPDTGQQILPDAQPATLYGFISQAYTMPGPYGYTGAQAAGIIAQLLTQAATAAGYTDYDFSAAITSAAGISPYQDLWGYQYPANPVQVVFAILQATGDPKLTAAASAIPQSTFAQGAQVAAQWKTAIDAYTKQQNAFDIGEFLMPLAIVAPFILGVTGITGAISGAFSGAVDTVAPSAATSISVAAAPAATTTAGSVAADMVGATGAGGGAFSAAEAGIASGTPGLSLSTYALAPAGVGLNITAASVAAFDAGLDPLIAASLFIPSQSVLTQLSTQAAVSSGLAPASVLTPALTPMTAIQDLPNLPSTPSSTPPAPTPSTPPPASSSFVDKLKSFSGDIGAAKTVIGTTAAVLGIGAAGTSPLTTPTIYGQTTQQSSIDMLPILVLGGAALAAILLGKHHAR